MHKTDGASYQEYKVVCWICFLFMEMRYVSVVFVLLRFGFFVVFIL